MEVTTFEEVEAQGEDLKLEDIFAEMLSEFMVFFPLRRGAGKLLPCRDKGPMKESFVRLAERELCGQKR